MTTQTSKTCTTCGNTDTTFRCSACKTTRYCSKECQQIDWKRGHKKFCIETIRLSAFSAAIERTERIQIRVEDICSALWKGLLDIFETRRLAKSNPQTQNFEIIPIAHYGRHYDEKMAVEYWYSSVIEDKENDFLNITDMSTIITASSKGVLPKNVDIAHKRRVELVSDGVLTQTDALAKIATGKGDAMTIGLACAIAHIERHGLDVTLEGKPVVLLGTFCLPNTMASRLVEVFEDPSTINECDWPLGAKGKSEFIGWHDMHRVVGFTLKCEEQTTTNQKVEYVVDPTAIQYVCPMDRKTIKLEHIWPAVIGAPYPDMRKIDDAVSNSPDNVYALIEKSHDIRAIMSLILASLAVRKATFVDVVDLIL